MATKIGDLFFDVTANVSSAIKSVDGLGSKFQSAGSAASRAIGETVANAAGLAATAMGALTVATLDAGAAFNIAGQRATGLFTALSGSLEGAQDILRDVNQLAIDNPIFDPTQLQRSTRMLLAYGVAADDAFELATNVNLVATAVDGGTQRALNLARAIGQISAAGILQGDEARQLSEFVDIYGLIAEETGKTRVEVRKLGEEHLLLAEDVIPVLQRHFEETFGPVGQSLLNTYGVQAQGLRNIMTGIGSALVSPFIGFGGGGALTESIATIRDELSQMVSVAEDGSFALEGVLEPLGGVMEDLAGSLTVVSDAFAGFLGNLNDDALTNFASQFEGMGPILAGVGAALATIFAQSIPLLGRFVAGFNPILIGITALIAASPPLREAFMEAFREIAAMIEPIIPKVQELLTNIVELAEEAGPVIADILVAAFEILVPLIEATLDATNDLIPVLGPVLIQILEEVASALQGVADLLEFVGPEVVLLTGTIYALAVAFPTLTLAIQLATASIGASGIAATVAGSAFLTMATAVGVALAAFASYKSIRAGITGDIDYLNEDVAFFERPFQQAGRIGFALGGGDREQAEYVAGVEAAEAAAAEFDLTLLEGLETVEEVRDRIRELGAMYGLTGDDLTHFTNLVSIARHEQIDAAEAELEASRNLTNGYKQQADAYLEFLEARAVEAQGWDFEEDEEKIDLLKELTKAAKEAWDAVNDLAMAGSDATVDDFLRELPDLAKDLTDALAGDGGILRDLDVSGVLNDVRKQAVDVIQGLAEDYGMSMDEIEALFDERGLAAVIEALGTVTESTTETIDPLIAKYGQLGATADQLGDALDRLNDQRQTGIKAQIDQVTAALEDAKQAAIDAREVFDNYFLGGTGGIQGAIDKLVLDIPSAGDAIEEGLLRGGPQGEAAIRQALGGVGSGVGEIFRLGLEQGLDPQTIAAMLAPVYGSINQELGGAANRITSLDWTEGFTPAAAAEIQSWLDGIVDPSRIGDLFSNVTGADNAVSGLQSQLDNLQAQLNVEVEFTAEQVQGALTAIEDEMTITVEEAVITPEAAALLLEEIQHVFDDKDLEAAIDQALITQDILDAAQAAEDQINLVFDSSLSFDSEQLRLVAEGMGNEFFVAWNREMTRLGIEEMTRRSGNLEEELAAIRAGSTPTIPVTAPAVTFNNDIVITETTSARATASEVIAAQSAASSGGTTRYDPSKFYGIVQNPFITQPGGPQ